MRKTGSRTKSKKKSIPQTYNPDDLGGRKEQRGDR